MTTRGPVSRPSVRSTIRRGTVASFISHDRTRCVCGGGFVGIDDGLGAGDARRASVCPSSVTGNAECAVTVPQFCYWQYLVD